MLFLLMSDFDKLYPSGEIIYKGGQKTIIYNSGQAVVKSYLGSDAYKEVSMLSLINHPNVIKPLAFSHNHHSNVMAFPLGLANKDNVIIPYTKDSLFELALTLSFLHQHRIIHNDLKIDNIIMLNGRPTLIDFELSEFLSPNEATGKEAFGSIGYDAPDPYSSYASDVYALGFVFYLISITTRINPQAIIDESLVKDEVLLDLLRKMTNLDASLRPTMQEVISHPYFQGCLYNPEASISEVTPPLPILSGQQLEKYNKMTSHFHKHNKNTPIATFRIYHNLHRIFHLIPDVSPNQLQIWFYALHCICTRRTSSGTSIQMKSIKLIEMMKGIIDYPIALLDSPDLAEIINVVTNPLYPTQTPYIPKVEVKILLNNNLNIDVKIVVTTKPQWYPQNLSFLSHYSGRAESTRPYYLAYKHHLSDSFPELIRVIFESTTIGPPSYLFEPFLDHLSLTFLDDLTRRHHIFKLTEYCDKNPLPANRPSDVHEYLRNFFLQFR
jgi:hypothetical protein